MMIRTAMVALCASMCRYQRWRARRMFYGRGKLKRGREVMAKSKWWEQRMRKWADA